MAQGILPDWLQAIITIALIASIIAIALQQAGELKKIQERARRTRKVVVEVDCGGRISRKVFAEGDYIGKRVECPDGQGVGIIAKIYAEEEESDQKGPLKKLSKPEAAPGR